MKEEISKEEVVEKTTTPKKEEKKEDKKGLFKKDNKVLEQLKLEEEKNALLQDKFIRLQAEMQNMRRRNEEERQTLLKYEGEELIKCLLPVIDNFERALSMNVNLDNEMEKYLSGFKLIYGNLCNTLKNYEVEDMDVLNKPFDPNTMEAVLVEEKEGVESNIVIEVLQKGYTYKGKVIRHAMVKVSK